MALCWLSPRWVHKVERSSSWFEIPNLDKIVHWGIFCAFALLWLRVSGSRRRYCFVALGGLALAAITELVQNLPIVNRNGSVADALADFIGVLIGLAIASWVEPFFRLIEARLFGKTVT
jgi:VanZ family protein